MSAKPEDTTNTFVMLFLEGGESLAINPVDGKLFFNTFPVRSEFPIDALKEVLSDIPSLATLDQDAIELGLVVMKHVPREYYHTFSIRLDRDVLKSISKTTLSRDPKFFDEFHWKCYEEHCAVLESRSASL